MTSIITRIHPALNKKRMHMKNLLEMKTGVRLTPQQVDQAMAQILEDIHLRNVRRKPKRKSFVMEWCQK